MTAAINTRGATYYTYVVGKTNTNPYVVPSPFLGMVGTRIICSRRRTCSSLFTRGSIKELASRVYRWVGTHALSMIGTDGDSGLWAGFGCSGDPRL